MLLLAGQALSAEQPFTFVVLGDRTGDARPRVFRQILAEVALLDPDLLVATGDLIEGYAADTAAVAAQWDSVLGDLSSTGVPFHLAPGNHDVSGPDGESLYRRHVGPLYHSLRYGSSQFIFVDNSRADSLSGAQMRWLNRELAAAKKAKHTFVFMHRPYWRVALEEEKPEPLHERFRAAGVDFVFTGHDHFYCSHVWDSVRYFQVGPSGSRLKDEHDPGAGAFQNYLVCRVNGDTVMVEVREPGRARPLPADTVTLASRQALAKAREQAVVIPVLNHWREGRDWTITITLRNVTDSTLSGRLEWQDSATAWHVTPKSMAWSVSTSGLVSQSFKFALARPEVLHPLPRFSLPYAYLPGRTADLGRRLAVRRSETADLVTPAPVIDGRLDDPGWRDGPALTEFGSEDGGASPLGPTEVWVGWHDSLLYIAARCHDSLAAGLPPGVSARDGRVYEDDNLNLLLLPRHRLNPADSLTYYQVMVNPAGTIADRICRFEDGKTRKDYSWDGGWKVATEVTATGWTLEMSCPLKDLGAAEGGFWALNVCRFRARDRAIAVWQVPFEHQPDRFGTLSPPK
jgi:hypothetical protein